MKRTLTILTVLTLLTGALFAADPYLPGGDTITLNAEVKRVEPVFEFYGSMDGSFSPGDGTKKGGETINTGKDLTEGNSFTPAVRAYFKLTQAELARYTGKLKVTFTATNFSDGKNEANNKIKFFYHDSINHTTTYNEIIWVDIDHSVYGGGITSNSFECILDYKKSSPIAKNTDMITVSFDWYPDATLPASEDYTATVSVTIAPTT